MPATGGSVNLDCCSKALTGELEVMALGCIFKLVGIDDAQLFWYNVFVFQLFIKGRA